MANSIFVGLFNNTVIAAESVVANSIDAANFIEIGSNPAQSGAVRLANTGAIQWRAPGNNYDSAKIQEEGNTLYVSADGALLLYGAYVATGIGIPLNLGGLIRFINQPAPAPPGVAGYGYLYFQDTGTGKSRLMVQFATGAAIALATEA